MTELITVEDVKIIQIRARGPGGQHVNKVSTSVQLRFDIQDSKLPVVIKKHLLELKDRRISKSGIVIVKSQKFRSQVKNIKVGIVILNQLVELAYRIKIPRKPTKPSSSSNLKRLKNKKKRGESKSLRAKVDF